MKNLIYIANKISFRSSSRFTRIMLRIAVITIALSVAIMLLAVAITRGFNKEISAKMYDLWGHIYVSGTYYDQTFETEALMYDSSLVDEIMNVRLYQGRKECRIESVNPVVLYSGIVQANGELEGLFLKGVKTDYMTEVLDKHIYRSMHSIPARRSIILSETTANRLEVDTGDVLVAHFALNQGFVSRKFQIGQLYKTGLIEFDEGISFLDLGDLQQALKWDSKDISGYELFVNDVSGIDTLDSYLYDEVLPLDVFSISIRDKYPTLFQWLEIMRGNELLIVVFFMIVCVVNLTTILLVIILDKMELIGVLKSLGISRLHLKLLFMMLGLRILVSGMVLGNLLAVLLGFLQQRHHTIKLNEADYFIAYVPIHFQWSVWIWLNVIILISGALVLLLPSIIITRFRPSQIFRLT